MTEITLRNFKKWEADLPTVGDILGLTARRVTQLVAEGVIPRTGRGKYPIAKAIAGYLKWLQDAKQRTAPSAARERLIEARARSIELQNEEREHKLIDADEAIGALDEIVGIFRSEMDGLPARLTRDLDERKIVEDAVNAIGNRAADKLAQRAAELRTNGSIEVPIEEDDIETD